MGGRAGVTVKHVFECDRTTHPCPLPRRGILKVETLCCNLLKKMNVESVVMLHLQHPETMKINFIALSYCGDDAYDVLRRLIFEPGISNVEAGKKTS